MMISLKKRLKNRNAKKHRIIIRNILHWSFELSIKFGAYYATEDVKKNIKSEMKAEASRGFEPPNKIVNFDI